MDVKCQVCQHKDQEIIFLRSLVESMFSKKQMEEAYFYPTAINEHGEVVKYSDPDVVEADDIVFGQSNSEDGDHDAA